MRRLTTEGKQREERAEVPLKSEQDTLKSQFTPQDLDELHTLLVKFEAALRSNHDKHKGVNYDVGSVMGVNWRPDYNPQTVDRELEIIKNDLHCNAVGISGKDIGRVMLTAEAALSQGLEAWLNPADWTNKPPEPTLAYITEAARAAQPLHERYPGKVVFSVGSEFTLFMQGIMPGKTFMQRLQTAFSADYVKCQDRHNKPLNDFLGRTNKAVRAVFDGPVMYRSLVWEQVDWS